MKRILTSVVIALAGLASAIPAGAATIHPSYPLHHNAHCQTYYVSIIRTDHVLGRHRECIWRPSGPVLTVGGPIVGAETTDARTDSPAVVVTFPVTVSGHGPPTGSLTIGGGACDRLGATGQSLCTMLIDNPTKVAFATVIGYTEGAYYTRAEVGATIP